MMTIKTLNGLIAVAILSACSSGSSNSSDPAAPKPEIVAFSASATKVKVNTDVSLSWESKNADNCLVKNEANAVLAEGQSGSTSQTIVTTQNFTLWCHNDNQSVEAKLVVSASTESGTRIVSQNLSAQPNLWNLDHIDGEMDGFFRAVGSGKGVRVYVIDTGVFGDHPEFEGRVLEGSNIFGEMMEGTGDVGYPKKGWLDTIGVQKIALQSTTRAPQFDDHGTHVAATVAGKTFGIAKEATIIPVRMSDGQGIFDDDDKLKAGRDILIEALNFVLANERTYSSGRAVVNVSRGIERLMLFEGRWIGLDVYTEMGNNPSTFSDPLDEKFAATIIKLVESGIPIFTAAGNSGCISTTRSTSRYVLQHHAQDIEGLVNVGNLGLDSESGELFASNTSLFPEFWAPGKDILSASGSFVEGKVTYGEKVDTGTSMASPLLAGLAAILLERSPDLSPAAIESALKQNASTRKRLDHRGHGHCRAIEDKDVFIPFLGQK